MSKSLHRRPGDVPGPTVLLLHRTHRRIIVQRMNRTRAVYSSPAVGLPRVERDDVDDAPRPARWRGRLDRVPRSRLGGVVLRPVGDAVATVQAIRSL